LFLIGGLRASMTRSTRPRHVPAQTLGQTALIG
jgi:hypothetical protein